MKLQRFIGVVLSVGSVLSLVAAKCASESSDVTNTLTFHPIAYLDDEPEPEVITELDVVATAAFPESNAFGRTFCFSSMRCF
jgi:hypothetical protein